MSVGIELNRRSAAVERAPLDSMAPKLSEQGSRAEHTNAHARAMPPSLVWSWAGRLVSRIAYSIGSRSANEKLAASLRVNHVAGIPSNIDVVHVGSLT